MAKRKNPFRFMITVVFRLLWICFIGAAAAALILSCASTFVHPQSSSFIALLGIGCQILIMFNIIIFTFLATRKKMTAIIPAVALLFSIGFWGDFYQFPVLKNNKEETKQINELKLMSYNVHNFRSPLKYERTIDSIVLFMRMTRADIICLQEFGSLTDDEKKLINRNMSHFTYSKQTHDQAIFSRYKISDYKQVRSAGNMQTAVRATIDFNGTKFGLYNLHMQTTEFNSMVPQGLFAFFGSDKLAEDARNTAKVVLQNSAQRADQAIQIDSMISAEGLPTIIMGDFNDTPASYVYSLLSNDRTDAFRAEGKGYGYTYKKLKRMFRIDYILVPDDYEVVRYDSPNLRWSDHNPVISNIIIK